MKLTRPLCLCVLTLLASATLRGEWNIETPSQEISGELSGEIFGHPFQTGDAIWNSNCLIISSKNKVGYMNAAKLFIFVKHQEGQDEWLLTPDSESHPHIHMHFAKESSGQTNTLMFTSEYSMFLKVVEREAEKARIQIHLSLPDYKHSYLLGEFSAEFR